MLLDVVEETHNYQRALGATVAQAINPYDICALSVDNCTTITGKDAGAHVILKEVRCRRQIHMDLCHLSLQYNGTQGHDPIFLTTPVAQIALSAHLLFTFSRRAD